MYNDVNKLPYHEFGVYSIAEKTIQQRPVEFLRTSSPPPALNRQVRSDINAPPRPQASKVGNASNKMEKGQPDWCLRTTRMSSQKINQVKGRDSNESSFSNRLRQGSGAGEPRIPRLHSERSNSKTQLQKNSAKSNDSNSKNLNAFQPTITTFRSTNGPAIKNVNDARNFLLRCSKYNEERVRQLLAAVTVTPQSYTPSHTSNFYHHCPPLQAVPHVIPSTYSTATKGSTQPSQRRRLGRSPSPPQARMSTEHTRATNTPPATPKDKQNMVRDYSKSGLREALSRLKLAIPRDGSIGAASLGARREAPAPRRAPSVRSDERPLATQGDLLNSIKFQKRLRDTLHTDKFHDKLCPTLRDRPSIKKTNSKTNTAARLANNQLYSMPRDTPVQATRNLFGPTRPASPKGRRSPHSPPNY